MYVVISGEKGEGKTTELLRLCATHLKEKKTVVFHPIQYTFPSEIVQQAKSKKNFGFC